MADQYAKNKISIYLPEAIQDWLKEESKRLDRPVSWLIQHSVKLARKTIAGYKPPAVGLPEIKG